MSDTPSIPFYHITSNPLPMSPEMFATLGEIVVLWSRIESSIDMDITTMMQWPAARALVTERPQGFSKKLVLWRRCVRALYPTIELYQGKATEIKRVAGIVAKFRNHVIHGSWSVDPTESGGFNVTSLRHGMDLADYVKFEVSLEFLQALLTDMRTLDSEIVSLVTTKMLHGHFGLLKAERGPSPEHPAPQSPPKPSKRKRQRRSSPE